MKIIYDNPEVQYYKYEIVWSAEDRAYIASVKELGLLTHHEKSPTKALKEIMKVVDFVLSDMKEDGEEIPQPEGFTRFKKEVEEKPKRDFSLDAEEISKLYSAEPLTEEQKEELLSNGMGFFHPPRIVDSTLKGTDILTLTVEMAEKRLAELKSNA